MKIVVTCLCLILILSAACPLCGQEGYSSGAYSELESEGSFIDKVSDWAATVGKSEEEKAVIMSRRRANRKMSEIRKKKDRKIKEIMRKKEKALKAMKAKENN